MFIVSVYIGCIKGFKVGFIIDKKSLSGRLQKKLHGGRKKLVKEAAKKNLSRRLQKKTCQGGREKNVKEASKKTIRAPPGRPTHCLPPHMQPLASHKAFPEPAGIQRVNLKGISDY